MRKKKSRITITWDDEQAKLLEQVAEKHGDAMDHNDIDAYTSTTPTGKRKPNASGIFRYLLMSATGNIKHIR